MSDYNILSDIPSVHRNDLIDVLELSPYMRPWIAETKFKTIGDLAEVLNACPPSVMYGACRSGAHTFTELIYRLGRYAVCAELGVPYSPGDTGQREAGGHSGGANWASTDVPATAVIHMDRAKHTAPVPAWTAYSIGESNHPHWQPTDSSNASTEGYR